MENQEKTLQDLITLDDSSVLNVEELMDVTGGNASADWPTVHCVYFFNL